MRKLVLYLAAAAMALPLVASAASPQKPGQWQTTTQFEMTGMPMQIPPQTTTTCLTAKDVEDPSKSLPKSSRDNGNCKFTDYKINGNSITWHMSCSGESKVDGDGAITYTADTFTGSMKMHVVAGGEAHEMSIKYSGKRLGDCSK